MKTTSFNRRVRVKMNRNKMVKSMIHAILELMEKNIKSFSVIELCINEIVDHINTYEKHVFINRLNKHMLRVYTATDGLIEIIKIKDSKMIGKNEFIKKYSSL